MKVGLCVCYRHVWLLDGPFLNLKGAVTVSPGDVAHRIQSLISDLMKEPEVRYCFEKWCLCECLPTHLTPYEPNEVCTSLYHTRASWHWWLYRVSSFLTRRLR